MKRVLAALVAVAVLAGPDAPLLSHALAQRFVQPSGGRLAPPAFPARLRLPAASLAPALGALPRPDNILPSAAVAPAAAVFPRAAVAAAPALAASSAEPAPVAALSGSMAVVPAALEAGLADKGAASGARESALAASFDGLRGSPSAPDAVVAPPAGPTAPGLGRASASRRGRAAALLAPAALLATAAPAHAAGMLHPDLVKLGGMLSDPVFWSVLAAGGLLVVAVRSLAARLAGKKAPPAASAVPASDIRAVLLARGKNVGGEFAKIAAALGDDAVAELNRRGSVRVVVAKDDEGGLREADAGRIGALLKEQGITAEVTVEAVSVGGEEPPAAVKEGPAPAAEQDFLSGTNPFLRGARVVSRALEAARRAGPGGAWRAVGRAAAAPVREGAFLTKTLLESMTKPTWAEVYQTYLFRSLPAYLTVSWLLVTFLPGHAVVFGVYTASALGLKVFHGVWVDSWNNFQDKLVRRRGTGYLTAFNLVYGQFWGVYFRALTWLAIAGTVAPWTFAYWGELTFITIVGTFVSSLATQGYNDLYRNGVIPRWARSALVNGRTFLFSFSGVFWQTGSPVFTYFFWLNRFADLALFAVGTAFPRRPVLYLASPEVAGSKRFAAEYSEEGRAGASPVRDALAKAFRDPFIQAVLWLPRWLAAAPVLWSVDRLLRTFAPSLAARRFWRVAWLLALVTGTPYARPAGSSSDVAAAYEKTLAVEPRWEDSPLRRSLPRLALRRAPDGTPVKKSSGWSSPFEALDPEGRAVVFKPTVKQDSRHPQFARKRTKVLADVVGSFVMERMGVPAVRYHVARADVDGREVIGPYSYDVPIATLRQAGGALAAQDGDVLVKGLVVDAWLGNVDRILNEGNVWMAREAFGGVAKGGVVFGDFDQALKDGVSVLGVPKVPPGIFMAHATRENVARAVGEVAALTDRQVAAMVREALADTYGLGEGYADYFTRILIRNRDLLKSTDPFGGLLRGERPRVRIDKATAALLADAVYTQHGDFAAPRAEWVERMLSEVMVKWDRPEAQTRLMRRVMTQAVEMRFGGAPAADIVLGEDDLHLLDPLMHFVYAEVSARAALEGGVGHHP